ncbi:MAG: hypothetical protein F6K03_12230 [Kamptonema sp. SIO4C4]|nr:hypothetical protein [Kamptonema sp. SIO4C4]
MQLREPTGLDDGSFLFDYTLKSYPPGCTAFQKELLMGVYSLQNYNLWHEDRSSMSQSLEARVPFLDHRLVEYLAGIPPQHHATLFWNKTIIREMAKTWLPAEYCDRNKSHATEPSRYNPMKRRMIQRVFPEFQDKYLTSPNQMLLDIDPATLQDWFEQVTHNPQDRDACEHLLSAITMTVFKQLCYNRTSQLPNDNWSGYFNQRFSS